MFPTLEGEPLPNTIRIGLVPLLHKFRIFYAQLAAHAGATNRLFQNNIHSSSFCGWAMPLRCVEPCTVGIIWSGFVIHLLNHILKD